MNKDYIHYGNTKLHEIPPIKNQQHWTKPQGGLWATPYNSKFGWKEWCTRENFNVGSLSKSFTFKLKDDAKIIHIYSVDDLDGLPKLEDEFPSWTLLDYEKLAQNYDGIELHLSEEIPPKHKSNNRWNNLYFELYGWDCDSILLFNSDCILDQERIKSNELLQIITD